MRNLDCPVCCPESHDKCGCQPPLSCLEHRHLRVTAERPRGSMLDGGGQ